MNAASNWPRNRLLLALPSRNLKRVMPELENISCHRAQVLMDADSTLDHARRNCNGTTEPECRNDC